MLDGFNLNSSPFMGGDFNLFSSDFNNESGLKIELSEDLELKVISNRNRFFNLFLFRYMELLPSVIKYRYTENKLDSLHFMKLETALRSGYDCIVGEMSNGNIGLLGYVRTKTNYESSNPMDLMYTDKLSGDSINFIIPEKYRLPEKDYQEITRLDNCESGNFVVVRNKLFNFSNDYKIIYHYANSLAEIVSSRFSLIIQSKAMTVFKSDPQDETINQIVSKVYNGSPFLKLGKLFDWQDDVFTFDNASLASNLAELKREYQNQLNELNSMVGLDALGVDKESGVSDAEVASGNPFSKNIANIYIDSRQQPFSDLSKRYDFETTVYFDNNVSAELNNLNVNNDSNEKEGEETENNNNAL